MTANKRIFLNIVATYGRSLYGLAIGLFCGRWTLMALGEVDYGLMGVVGGLTGFVSFLNGILASSISRFYAFSIGAQGKGKDGLYESRRWFSVAVSLHTVIPVILMLIGYPLGSYAVRNWLTIPIDRIEDCVLVYRCVCASCFVGMVTVPFSAMYTAKQYIAELTIYSVVTTTMNVCILYYIITHPGVWLVKLALCQCALSLIPSVVISLRAYCIFDECRILKDHLWNLRDLRELLSYSGWNLFGAFGNLMKSNGMAVLVNKCFGPIQNAAMTVANTVTCHALSLSASMIGAFIPAVTQACGAGDMKRAISLTYTICKFGTLFTLIFAIPLALEANEVMVLWLKHPPAQAPELCILILIMLALDGLTTGHWILIAAKGRIALYQFVVGTAIMLSVVFAWMFVKVGCGLLSVGYGLIMSFALVTMARVIFVWKQLKMPIWFWVRSLALPIVTVTAISCVSGVLMRCFMEESFIRLCATTLITESVFLPLSYFFVLGCEEKLYVRIRLGRLLKR